MNSLVSHEEMGESLAPRIAPRTDMNTRLVSMAVTHYSKQGLSIESIEEISNSQAYCGGRKPFGGLWTSPAASNYGWREFCEQEDYCDLTRLERHDLRYIGETVIIDSVSDMQKLPWVRASRSDWIDFEAIATSGYDGIWLTERGQELTHFTTLGSRDLYGWDCETLLILRPEAIQAPKPASGLPQCTHPGIS